MALALIADNIIDDGEAAVEAVNLRVHRKRLRDSLDPFDVDDEYFINLFRISKDVATDLINILRPFVQRQRSSGLSVEYQVLCAVRFYAVGSYQRAVGQDFLIAISQTAVSRCIHDISNAMNDHMLRQWIKFPSTQQQRAEALVKFANAAQPFPGAIGAIDCTHISIIAPKDHEEAFVNHHGVHSMNIQTVCDPGLKILNVCARFPGSRHDAAIWAQFPVRTLMQMWYDRNERGTWLLGDSGYPLEPWIMTPVVNAVVGMPEHAYTMAHCKARSVIERCFGMLKMVWRCLHTERILMYEPAMAGKIINACSILHNMRLHYRVPNDPVVREEQEPRAAILAAEPLQAHERLAEARRIREDIIVRLF